MSTIDSLQRLQLHSTFFKFENLKSKRDCDQQSGMKGDVLRNNKSFYLEIPESMSSLIAQVKISIL